MPLSPMILSLALAWPFSHPADTHREHHRIGAWTLTATRSRFADTVQCRLTARHVRYERQALVLQMPATVDTSSAIYRIDGGAPHWVTQDAFQLAKLGFQLTQDDLDNPSQGLVRIPTPAADVRAVGVQTRFGGPVTTFKVAGLGAALEAARQAGCRAFE